MKKVLALTVVLFSFFVLCSSASADDDRSLPTIDEALRTMATDSGRIEVSDDLSAYDPDNYGEIDFGEYRFIFLERWAPEKEFTEYDSGYPSHFVSGFPDDFEGVDIGPSRVWLRCDLMNKLPRYMQAASMAEADVILIAETQYSLMGWLTVTDYEKTHDEDIPQFNTPDELEAYISSHQPVIKNITYYPKFGVYTLIDLYDSATKQCSIYDGTISLPKRFASNPDAQDFWDNMEELAKVIRDMDDHESAAERYASAISNLEVFVPEIKLNFWKSCIDSEEFTSVSVSMNEYYWNMAEELMSLDPDSDHQANYKMLIEEQNYQTLAMFVNYCNYSGFETPIAEIRVNKEYLGTPDYGWMEDALNELVDILNA